MRIRKIIEVLVLCFVVLVGTFYITVQYIDGNIPYLQNTSLKKGTEQYKKTKVNGYARDPTPSEKEAQKNIKEQKEQQAKKIQQETEKEKADWQGNLNSSSSSSSENSNSSSQNEDNSWR